MVMLDLTIVNIALPSVQRELHFSPANLTWVIDAYVLVFGGLLLLGGRTGDLFGRRRMFVVGIALFATASLAGGLATDQAWLIAARAVQGAGAAVASPTALALIAATFGEGPERNRAMAVYAAMSAAGGALGLLLGGALVEVSSWRWVLFVNVPIAAVVLSLTPAALTADHGPGHRGDGGRLDVPGALSVSGGMALLVYALVRAPGSGWANAGTLASFAGALLALSVFVGIELSSPRPLLPLGFLRHRARGAGYAMMLLIGAAMLSLIYFLTQYLQEVLHYSPVVAGAAYLPVPVSVAAAGVSVSHAVRRYGTRRFLTVGPLLIALGLLWASELTSSSNYFDVLGPLVVVGVGMGLSFVPLTLNAVSSVERHQSGLASALLNTSQQVGGSLGLAALATVAATSTRDQLRHFTFQAHGRPGAALVASATVHGFDMAIRSGAAAAGLAFVVALVVLGTKRAPSALVEVRE
jgi:EmrB/QacA subfamily drug resistance transporter